MTTALLALAVRAAEAAGTELLRRYGHAEGVQSKSSATDPVSDADRAAEQLLVETLLAARPLDGVLAEEGATVRGRSGLRWVLDPLDGTVNYLYGHPGWCVSVAAEDAGGMLVGVVRDPLRAVTFSAVRGGAAHRDGQVLRVNDPVALDRALVATGFAYDAGMRARQGAVLAALLPQVRDVRRVGSCALDLCAVAAGTVDGYYERGVAPWDWAAGGLIVAAAGGEVRAEGDLVLAAGPALVGSLHAAVTAPR